MKEHVDWHTLPAVEVENVLQTDRHRGLANTEAKERLLEYGANKLEKKKRFQLLTIIFKQLVSPLNVVLMLAGVATIVLQEHLDAIVIGVAVLVNVVIGAFQEGRASRVFDKLASTQEREVTVLREGRRVTLEIDLLVPGDVVLLESGKSIVADLRIVVAHDLAINEAALTGEWVAVEKINDPLSRDAAVAEQTNMAWSGTIVTEGSGIGIVVATGEHTQLGQIARSTEEAADSSTPLQKSVRHIARFMLIVIAVALVLLIALGLLRGEGFAEMLLIAIAVAVAAMPEGLPAAVTVVLAVGMESILRKGGLVKRLLAAETLGSTTVILTDKTGTLTKGEMSVAALYTLRGREAHDVGPHHSDNRELLKSALFGSDAFLEQGAEGAEVHGRPVERALVRAGIDADMAPAKLFERGYKREEFVTFESKRRFSAALVSSPGGSEKRLSIVGAPELLLSHATRSYVNGHVREFEDTDKEEFKHIQQAESIDGHRFVAVAYVVQEEDRIPDSIKQGRLPKQLVFLGLISLADTVRDDVAEQIQSAKRAGIRVVMVTGDYQETARAIASQVGIAKREDPAVTGRDMEDMEDAELLSALKAHTVFARVLPKQKLRIARVLRSDGEVIAMTGDGVNDSPALVSADIGVAVGSGTDVAQEAADLVLLNSTFSTITAAIREGRRAVDNLRKIVVYLLSTAFAEIVIISGALIVGGPLPLLTTQILWANIVAEGLMSFPFAFEPAEKNVMRRPPATSARSVSPSRLILTPRIVRLIGFVALITGGTLVALYLWLLSENTPIEKIQTIMFLTLSLYLIPFSLAFKDLSRPVWRTNLFSNPTLIAGLLINSLLLAAAFVFTPLTQLLSLVPLTGEEVLIVVGLTLANLIIIEAVKLSVREK